MDYFELERHPVDLRAVELPGRILDLGGGGDGVIARCAGERVVAIDLRADELAEAPDMAGIKIVMDARDLQFVGECFDTVTSFYTLLYVDDGDIEQVLREACRVLRPGGRLLLWDAVFGSPERAVIVAQVAVSLPDGAVLTPGYGASWTRAQDAGLFAAACRAAGFRDIEHTQSDAGFFLTAVKA